MRRFNIKYHTFENEHTPVMRFQQNYNVSGFCFALEIGKNHFNT